MAAMDQTVRPPQSSRQLTNSGQASLGGTGGYNGAGTHPFLQSKFQVGSVKSQKVNFSLAQKVFHSGDVPPEVLATKRSVQKSKQANILGTEPKDWNQSTIANQSIQKDPKDVKKQLMQVRAGLLDEKALKVPKNHSDEKIAEMQKFIVNMTGQGPIGKCTTKWFNALDERGLAAHCVRDDWPDWNASHSCHTKDDSKQAAARYDEMEARRHRMMKHDPKLDKEAYVDPKQAVTNVNDRLRERKIDFQELKEAFKRELRVEFPTASEERLQAMAQRLLNEKLLGDEKLARFPVQHETMRPNLSLTTQDRRYKEYYHPGVWQWSEAEKRNCWSCCLNYGEGSRGCEYRVTNPDAWCTLGFERRPGVAIAGKA